MSLILARIVVSIALFCAPFLLFIALSKGHNAGMILIIPIFGGVPAIIAALLIFWPIEAMLNNAGVGWLKNLAIPLAGCLIAFLFFLIAGWKFGNLDVVLRNLAKNPGDLLVWSVFGGAWGVVWRLTELIAKWIGLVRG